MRINLSKPGHVLFFIVFLPAISFGVSWIVGVRLPDMPFWLEGLSPLGAYALFYWFFDKLAWSWPVFRWLGVVDVPDLRGRWEGQQLSSAKTEKGKPIESRVVMEVKQTFSSISTCSFYSRWNDAHSASSFMDIDGQLYLVVLFESEPGVRHDGSEVAHKGVARLRLDSGKIVGQYFNSNGNFGQLELKRKTKKLLGRFAV